MYKVYKILHADTLLKCQTKYLKKLHRHLDNAKERHNFIKQEMNSKYKNDFYQFLKYFQNHDYKTVGEINQRFNKNFLDVRRFVVMFSKYN